MVWKGICSVRGRRASPSRTQRCTAMEAVCYRHWSPSFAINHWSVLGSNLWCKPTHKANTISNLHRADIACWSEIVLDYWWSFKLSHKTKSFWLVLRSIDAVFLVALSAFMVTTRWYCSKKNLSEISILNAIHQNYFVEVAFEMWRGPV